VSGNLSAPDDVASRTSNSLNSACRLRQLHRDLEYRHRRDIAPARALDCLTNLPWKLVRPERRPQHPLASNQRVVSLDESDILCAASLTGLVARTGTPLYRRNSSALASSFWARSILKFEIEAKLLTDLGANSRSFSECTLILQRNLSDFDSAMRRFESSRPSLTVCSLSLFGNGSAALFGNSVPETSGPLASRCACRLRVAARARSMGCAWRNPHRPCFCAPRGLGPAVGRKMAVCGFCNRGRWLLC
jgi:hypothetical protein